MKLFSLKATVIFFNLLIIGVTSISVTNAQHLKRMAGWGTGGPFIDTSFSKSSNSGIKGQLVEIVSEKSTSEQFGIKKGDIIIKINGVSTDSRQALMAGWKNVRANDPVTVEYYRKGKKKSVRGKAIARPLDQFDNANVLYSEVPFREGYLRNILITPKGDPGKKYPVVFLIQGYTCSGMDRMPEAHPYQKITMGLIERGYAVYKMEKPGMGDCFNTGECDEIDYYTEQAAFQAGFDAMKSFENIDQNNLFVFGHSMGGIIAPMLQQTTPIKGIAVYGTGIKPWFEYFIDMYRQQFIFTGADYVENDLAMQEKIPFCYEFMVLKKTPKELAKNNPTFEKILKEDWHWDGENKIESRDYKYWQQLQEPGLFEAWKNTKSKVLSIWGASDFVAFSKQEHVLITDVVNHYHPGNARYLEIPESDHGFTKTKDQFDSAKHWGDWNYMTQNFNPAIVLELDKWMKEVMKK